MVGEQQPTRRKLHEIRERDGGQTTLALVQGESVSELPKDLYIPPHALEVFLETFEGPLDLLLYLIRRENLDILQIRVAEITEQYMSYIDLMSAMQLELAGEYLVMAAMLAEIKSRMLLPRPIETDDDEDDPRAELIRRLQEYEQIKSAAENIDELPRLERDIFIGHVGRPELVREHADPEVDLKEVLLALARVLKRAEMYQHHEIHLEPLSVRERMTSVLGRVNESRDFVPFSSLFSAEEGRLGVVVTFLAVMELLREALVDFVQNEPFGPIYLRVAGAGTAGEVTAGEVTDGA
jgi:segregation and condensation protein A